MSSYCVLGSITGATDREKNKTDKNPSLYRALILVEEDRHTQKSSVIK